MISQIRISRVNSVRDRADRWGGLSRQSDRSFIALNHWLSNSSRELPIAADAGIGRPGYYSIGGGMARPGRSILGYRLRARVVVDVRLSAPPKLDPVKMGRATTLTQLNSISRYRYRSVTVDH
jgi:hypothetical protein